MHDAIKIILAILTVYRLARLFSKDTITDPIRANLGKRAADQSSWPSQKLWHFIADLVNCPLCLGVWIAAVVSLLLRPVDIFEFFFAWLGIAGGQYLLQVITDGD